jgi:hypothetical protein
VPAQIDCLRSKVHDRITSALCEGTLDEMMEASLLPTPKPPLPVTRTGRGSLLMECPPVLDNPKTEQEELLPAEPQQPPPPPLVSQPRLPPKAEAALLDVEGARKFTEEQLLLQEERLRLQARDILVKATFDESLDRALMMVEAENAAAEAGSTIANSTTSPPTPDGKCSAGVQEPALFGRDTEKSAAVLALRAMSHRDRRVGELIAMIDEVKRQIAERDDRCTQIEERLNGVRLDIAHLELDVEWHRRAVEGAKERSCELEVSQRRLFGELDEHQQKFRHAKIEAQESCLMSARSELSTATGFTTSSLGCFTPRNPMTSSLEPLSSSSPQTARW